MGPSTDTDHQRTSTQRAENPYSQTVAVPRWVIYFQAALLGVIATTFFIFGLMVGNLTSGNANEPIKVFDCSITGSVQFAGDDANQPDVGAVVFLLPKDSKPEERAAGSSVSPDAFEPLNNPGIEIVHRLGGSVVRADANGNFIVAVNASSKGVEYYLLVVSKNVAETNREPLTKLQVAVIGTFYLPVERVINDRAIYWSTVTARGKSLKLSPVNFD